MSSWTQYPKIWQMGHPGAKRLFNGEVLVEEKVDGSQFSFGIIDGELKIRSKGVEMTANEPTKMFQKAVETVLTLKDRLTPGWTYRAEYLATPHHNALAYERVPANYIILFDIATGCEDYLPRAAKEAEAARLGLEIVPVLAQGNITNLDQFKALLNTVSVLGGQNIEGVVVKNYSQFGEDGKPVMAKYVREDFRELNMGAQRKFVGATNGDILMELTAMLRTEARFAKAVQHLRDAGTLQNAPQDIGPLMAEVQKDIAAEETERIKTRLFNWAWGKIKRSVTAGLPDWYKARLLETQFAADTEVCDALKPEGV